MKTNIEILSSITTFMKYAKYSSKVGRRESWEEICYRNRDMHLVKYPDLHTEILNLYNNFIIPKKVLPSMRSMQFAGKPIELSPNRIYNCCFLPMNDWRCFSETMFLLLGGTGVGYSVQSKHVGSLPEIKKPTKTRRYLIGDSIEGWADAVKAIFKAYMKGASLPKFDFSDIRSKGAALITSGGKAPGPTGLQTCLFKIKQILDSKEDGEQLTTLDVHDLQCHIADAVLTGGIRRAAMISLFDMDDNDMLTCKFGNWWELNPQRGRSNNSAVVIRHRITEKEFKGLWAKIEASGSGEPGIYLSNNADWGTNPSLRAGTRVYTSEGIFPIEELQDKEFYVKNLNGELSKARCWLSGKNKQLYKITLKGGHVYYSTPEHEWATEEGDIFTKKSTDKLVVGDKFPILRETKMFKGNLGDREDGFFIGWQLGDGGTHLRKDTGVLQHNLIVSKKDGKVIKNKLEDYLLNKLSSQVKFKERGSCYELNTCSKNWNNLQEKFGYTTKDRGLPKSVWKDGTEDFRKGIIDGLFSSDGHVEDVKKRISFCTKHEKLAKDVSDLIGFYGIKNSIKCSETKEGFVRYDVRITENRSIIQFKKIFTLTHEDKQKRILEYEYPYGIKEDNTIEIVGVELSEVKEDVWDISVYDETHCFQISQCITGNCCEIALKPYQFCNLTEINANDIVSQEDLEARAKAAAFLGTLQAGYSDFHYIRDIWKRTTEKDALIGVSMTGIASGAVMKLDLQKATEVVIEENNRVAKLIGINSAARTTCVKPAGTTSLVIGSSSGIHAWHDPYYIRRIRVGKNEAIYQYLAKNNPEILEDEFFNPKEQAVISVPVEAPSGAIFRNEPVIDLLERVKKISNEWVKTGHIKGENTHNVSATISVKDDEWDEVVEWMWNNRDYYNGLSVLPFDGGTYKQAPFETISKEEYERLNKQLKLIDLKEVTEVEDNTNLSGEVACSGGACEVK